MSAAATLTPMSVKPEPHDRHSTPPIVAELAVERIVLTGFMGSGKSTVGAMLAERLGWSFVDLDSEIERRCGLTVPTIFAELGEPHFRQQETSSLASVLGRTHAVIALGGGTPDTLGNRLLLEQTPATAVVFLDAPFALLHSRCLQQANVPGATARPLLAEPEQAEARFQTRMRHYQRIANLRLESSDLSPTQARDAILAMLVRRA